MKAEQELAEALAAWDDAIARNDLAEMSRYMSDDWVIVGTGGGITSKFQFLASIRSGDVVHTRMSSEETRIRIYGNTAVATARERR